MSEWSDVPLGLRVKIQSLNFLFYVVGIGLRAFLFVLLIAGIWLLKFHHWIVGTFCVVLSLVCMWEDAQRAERPGDWIRSKTIPKVLALLLLFPISTAAAKNITANTWQTGTLADSSVRPEDRNLISRLRA